MVFGMFSIQFETFAGFAGKYFCQFSDNLLGAGISDAGGLANAALSITGAGSWVSFFLEESLSLGA